MSHYEYSKVMKLVLQFCQFYHFENVSKNYSNKSVPQLNYLHC